MKPGQKLGRRGERLYRPEAKRGPLRMPPARQANREQRTRLLCYLSCPPPAAGRTTVLMLLDRDPGRRRIRRGRPCRGQTGFRRAQHSRCLQPLARLSAAQKRADLVAGVVARRFPGAALGAIVRPSMIATLFLDRA